MSLKTIRSLLLLLAGAALLAGCSGGSILPDKEVEYRRETQAEKNLEVPPDLISRPRRDRLSVPDAAGGANYSEYAQGRQNGAGGTVSTVLPEVENVQVMRDGEDRWLVVDAPPEEVWNQLLDFWQENGVLLVEQDPVAGVMRTSWLENRADIKSDFITNAIRSVFDGLYEAGTRDQFRVRLERGEKPGTTELYLTHFGMEEEVMTDTAGQGDQTVWINRPRDPNLEAEMLTRIMVHLGLSRDQASQRLAAAKAEAGKRSRLVKSDQGSALLINEDFSRAWRITGLALDRVGFAVEDRDRSKGLYYVRYNDPNAEAKDEGWFSRLWGSDTPIDANTRYRIRVSGADQGSRVEVLDDQGRLDNSATAQRILTLLSEQIR